MIGVVDYGAGNLQSIDNALSSLGISFRVCREPSDLSGVAQVVLPGVGHFGAAARRLAENGMREALREHAASYPLLGICLGMQLLLGESEEAPGSTGLDLIAGTNRRLSARRVPHMGWNRVRWDLPLPGSEETHYYFAHTFVVAPDRRDDVIAEVELDEQRVPVAVRRGDVVGVQFHPEKSGPAGLALLEGFARC